VAATAALATTTAGTAVVAGAFGGEASSIRRLAGFRKLLVYVVISSASRAKQVTLCCRMSVPNLLKERQALEGQRIWFQDGVVDLNVVHVHTKE
jgi:hypothetical protein